MPFPGVHGVALRVPRLAAAVASPRAGDCSVAADPGRRHHSQRGRPADVQVHVI